MNHTNLEIAVCKTFCLVMILYIFTAKTRAIPTVFDVFFSWLILVKQYVSTNAKTKGGWLFIVVRCAQSLSTN
jgi:hypothetical protein